MATNPSSFTATASLSKVSLIWTSSGATEYRIYRATNLGNEVLIHTADSGTFAFTDIVANYDSTGGLYDYEYRLAAWDSGGEASGISDTVTMPALAGSDVTGASVLASPLSTGNVSNTYANATTTPVINAHTTTMHETRNGADGKYDPAY